MNRTNVTTWSDCEVLTRHCHILVEELMKYQKHSLDDVKPFGGDQNLMIAGINLRNRLVNLIDRSPH